MYVRVDIWGKDKVFRKLHAVVVLHSAVRGADAAVTVLMALFCSDNWLRPLCLCMSCLLVGETTLIMADSVGQSTACFTLCPVLFRWSIGRGSCLWAVCWTREKWLHPAVYKLPQEQLKVLVHIYFYFKALEVMAWLRHFFMTSWGTSKVSQSLSGAAGSDEDSQCGDRERAGWALHLSWWVALLWMVACTRCSVEQRHFSLWSEEDVWKEAAEWRWS